MASLINRFDTMRVRRIGYDEMFMIVSDMYTLLTVLFISWVWVLCSVIHLDNILAICTCSKNFWEKLGLSARKSIYIWPSRDGNELHLARLGSMAEHGWVSTEGHLLSGT